MINNETITKFKTKLFKEFTDYKEISETNQIKENWIISTNNVIAIKLKNDDLIKECLNFFSENHNNLSNLEN